MAAPSPSHAEVRVRVAAAGLNRADLLQTLGLYPPPPGVDASIAGLEFAGEVAEVGKSARGFKVGDRVMGLVGSGAFAEEVVVHERELLSVPRNLSLEAAAAIPEAFVTAHDALVTQLGLHSGETVLIHAVTSGVGTAAAQLVRAVGARAIGTGRDVSKLQQVTARLGLDKAIACPTGPTFVEEVQAATGGAGAAVAIELVGGDYLPHTIQAMALKGRIALVGLLAGITAELPLALILSRRIRVFGTSLRSRALEEKIDAIQRLGREVVPLFERGLVEPFVEEALPFDRAKEAFERMAKNQNVGKLVLRW